MAQDSSNSLSETLDDSPSLTVDAIADHHQSSSSTTTTSSSSSQSPPASVDPSLSRNSSFSRLNAKAPEFVPRSSSSSPSIPQSSPHGLIHVYPGPNSSFHVPIHGGSHVPVPHHVPIQYHHHQHRPKYHGGVGFVDRQEAAVSVQAQQPVPAVEPDHVPPLKNGLSEEATLKILNQVEYYFSDLNLATTDHLMKFINKDVEGYVPISVVASFKKIKAAINSNSQLASILRNSNKLVVSDDGKKVRRYHPLTGSEMEELQSRIVVAENLPEDHCHQNLMKIFSAVGSVKTIRTCPPQTSNGGASSAGRAGKADGMLFSNKLHAFVEYVSVELAEKAVAELNDEANWRSGLRVRLLLRRTLKSAQARGKRIEHEGNASFEEDDTSTSEQPQPNEKHVEHPAHQLDTQSLEQAGEENLNEKEGGQKKGRNRGRGKGQGRGRGQYHHHHNNRGNHVVGTLPSNNSVNYSSNTEQPVTSKLPPGPRMPDGTRGFSMGRGKPITVISIAS